MLAEPRWSALSAMRMAESPGRVFKASGAPRQTRPADSVPVELAEPAPNVLHDDPGGAPVVLQRAPNGIRDVGARGVEERGLAGGLGVEVGEGLEMRPGHRVDDLGPAQKLGG